MTHQYMEIKIKDLEKRVEALEQDPYEDEELDFVQSHKKIKVNLVSCEDAISRKAAIDTIENEQKKIMRSDWAIDQAKFSAMSEIRALIADLPSVSTKKTGRWITHCYQNCKCSMCGYVISEYDSEEFKFCPNCGAKILPEWLPQYEGEWVADEKEKEDE